MSTVQETGSRRRGGCASVVLGIIALLAIAALALALLRPALFGLGGEKITQREIGASFQQIAELSVEEYVYSNVGTFDQEGFKVVGRTVPFTGRNFLVQYDGSVKAGLRDAEQVKVDVDDAAQSVTVGVPRVEVTENTIDPSTIVVYDQSLNPLNQVKVEDVTEFLEEQEKVAVDKAVNSGLLERAQTRTEELLRSHAEVLIDGTNMAGYRVEVRWV
ncbi:DUF4230 domain-containing protein [Corynebacterium qintianiae]|uniref:DUF4230 domain-containing protein n=1 Tax=Corynebacterium qintianiae TaxID=2709392 RepID=A0A7T0KL35_9CORY|nr:DUF4230 domain-containing protein [Corynebacterium qintianiae]QPK82761.1 DUF4230 domain-containing protein [Corynebacterium qintianiae]